MASLGLDGPIHVLEARSGEAVREAPGRRTWKLCDPRDGVDLYLKQYAAGAGRSGRIARWRSPAEVEALRLVELGRAGLPVPELVYACWRAGPRYDGATIQRSVPGSGLDELMSSAPEPDCGQVLCAQVVPIVAELHSACFFHRDLYSGHLIAERLGAPLTLVDVARVRRDAGFRQRLRVKDLAAILASFFDRVHVRALLRAFVLYCTRVALPARWIGRGGRRALARAVVRKARRIRRHRPRFDAPDFSRAL